MSNIVTDKSNVTPGSNVTFTLSDVTTNVVSYNIIGCSEADIDIASSGVLVPEEGTVQLQVPISLDYNFRKTKDDPETGEVEFASNAEITCEFIVPGDQAYKVAKVEVLRV